MGLDSFKWILYGDDDTVFFVGGALDMLENLDYNMPYLLSDDVWFVEDDGMHFCRLKCMGLPKQAHTVLMHCAVVRGLPCVHTVIKMLPCEQTFICALQDNFFSMLVAWMTIFETPRLPCLSVQLKASKSTLIQTDELPDAYLVATMTRLLTLGIYPGALSKPQRAAPAPMRPSARPLEMRAILAQTVNG